MLSQQNQIYYSRKMNAARMKICGLSQKNNVCIKGLDMLLVLDFQQNVFLSFWKLVLTF